MNNTTTRTHQYAVWLTVGFFEVVKEGNPRWPTSDDPNTDVSMAVDQLGNELNAAVGKNVRYRSYFLIDRSTATGFNPNDPGDYPRPDHLQPEDRMTRRDLILAPRGGSGPTGPPPQRLPPGGIPIRRPRLLSMRDSKVTMSVPPSLRLRKDVP